MNIDEEVIKGNQDKDKFRQKPKKKFSRDDFPLNNKDVWEKVLDSEKNGQVFKPNWVGIEKTPIY